jgi:hypothetical protein
VDFGSAVSTIRGLGWWGAFVASAGVINNQPSRGGGYPVPLHTFGAIVHPSAFRKGLRHEMINHEDDDSESCF